MNRARSGKRTPSRPARSRYASCSSVVVPSVRAAATAQRVVGEPVQLPIEWGQQLIDRAVVGLVGTPDQGVDLGVHVVSVGRALAVPGEVARAGCPPKVHAGGRGARTGRGGVLGGAPEVEGPGATPWAPALQCTAPSMSARDRERVHRLTPFPQSTRAACAGRYPRSTHATCPGFAVKSDHVKPWTGCRFVG